MDTTTAEQNVTGCDTSSNRMDAGQSVQSQDPSPATGTPQLAERRQLALRLLVIGKSVARVAKELEVSRQTIYRWREDPQFESELKQLRDHAWGEAVARLKGLLEPSLNILETELNSQSASLRSNTAKFLLRLPSISRAVIATGTSDANKT